MPAVLGPHELTLAAEVATRYYLRDESKVEIGARLGLSRFKVARMLEAAKAAGLVSIEVKDADGVAVALSNEVREAYGLERCVIAADAGTGSRREIVGRLGARVLTEMLGNTDVLGLPWARTVGVLVAALEMLPAIRVVQLSGSLDIVGEDSPVDMVRRAAVLTGVPAQVYSSPFILDDAALATAMRRQPAVAAAFQAISELTVAVVSVGAWTAGESSVFDQLPETTRDDAAARGVVGEALGVLFAADGSAVVTELDARMVTLSAAQLRAIPRVLALATGETKAVATAAFLRGGFATSLVADGALGRALLGLAGDGR